MVGRGFWLIDPLFNGKPPIPKGKIVCPICGSNEVYFKECHAFKHWVGGQYRVDIHVKCSKCGYVMTFGVHLSEKEFDKIEKKKLHWSEVGHRKL